MSRTATYVQQGAKINYTPVSSGVSAGQPVKLADGIYGIADRAIAEGEEGALTLEGVYAFTAGGAVSLGDLVYLDGGTVVTTPGDDTGIGVALGAAASSGCTVPVKINTQPIPTPVSSGGSN